VPTVKVASNTMLAERNQQIDFNAGRLLHEDDALVKLISSN
jgi:altronate dehydratase